MTCDSSEAKVKDFLSQVSEILNKPNTFQFIPRRKNIDALNKHGLTIDIVKMCIKNLTVKDYCKGPVEDENKDFSGDVWIFGKRIDEVLFYIKIKIKNDRFLCCLSFHDAEYDLDFSYK